jgi:acetoin utilization deacetylase AcuC-like enzyme
MKRAVCSENDGLLLNRHLEEAPPHRSPLKDRPVAAKAPRLESMFRIRRIYDDLLPVDRTAIAQVQDILRKQFPLLSTEKVNNLPDQLTNPFKYRFRSILFVAEGIRGRVKGFALLQHVPDLRFCYLDFISAATYRTGGGIGGALYQRVREEAQSLHAVGLFFESLPDEPSLCKDPIILKQNGERLRFYERFGARPIINTAYETPVKPDGDCPPYLVFDNLGKTLNLDRDLTRKIVRAVLETHYGTICSPAYIEGVVRSFRDQPVRLREPKYVKGERTTEVKPIASLEKRIALVVSDVHAVHHVHERGYVESPVRVSAILKELEPTHLFEKVNIQHFSDKYIKEVHDHRFVEFLKKVCANVEPGESVYPYVFPIRNKTRPPKELPIRAGYYCIDTFTPLNENAYFAAKRAVDCALSAARKVLEGYRLAYALLRPPGHHAETGAFGGFCYFNSAAISAHYMSAFGKVAVLDIDYHHGNGTQDVFRRRSDVLTLSIHGHPHFAYPYFSGFDDERGEGPGLGFNVNYPLPEHVTGEQYRQSLAKALRRIARYKANVLIVALGLDTAKGDPTGTWSLLPKDFRSNGRMIGSLRLPTLVVQEGGYRIRTLGTNARYFFLGLWEGMHRFSDPFRKGALNNNKQESEKRGNHQPSRSQVPGSPSPV